mmetsp:Transcript_11706/g.30003  ORF Transcript_11706/g.30003 Transcript_11706/m.30003 type:complete len:228 (-) Transcript_11706:42-725(-)
MSKPPPPPPPLLLSSAAAGAAAAGLTAALLALASLLPPVSLLASDRRRWSARYLRSSASLAFASSVCEGELAPCELTRRTLGPSSSASSESESLETALPARTSPFATSTATAATCELEGVESQPEPENGPEPGPEPADVPERQALGCEQGPAQAAPPHAPGPTAALGGGAESLITAERALGSTCVIAAPPPPTLPTPLPPPAPAASSCCFCACRAAISARLRRRSSS